MRIAVIIAWLVLLAAPLALFVGHLGARSLNWRDNQVSTYAALAPHANWVSVGMVLSAVSICCIGVGISLDTKLRINILSQIASMFCGAAASGLLMLFRFKETARTTALLKEMEFPAIRQQTFHDAGLLIFFSGVMLALMTSGLIAMIRSGSWGSRMLAAVVLVSGPVAYAALVSSWQEYLGFSGTVPGLKQRAAFFCFWVGALSLMALITKATLQSIIRQSGINKERFDR
jgi:hypothetical protein